MDFAIGLSLANGISGEISRIVGDFRRLDGVTDATMEKLSQFKNISITGGLLAGAGIKGLQATADVLGDCISEAEKLQSSALTLEIKTFGNDLLDQTKLPQIKAEMEELNGKAMDISLNTVFNAQEITESMTSLVKGGMSKEMVANGGAEANAYFAQINDVRSVSTADATVKFVAGFQLKEDQVKDSLDLITKYADASISDALAIQQNIGNTAGSAMSVWKNRDNMTVAEETIQLVAATKYTAGDEASAATYVRNFLDQAGKTTFTDPQTKMMEEAGWLQDGKSIFIDYNTGMLKSAAELEKILESTAEKMDAVEFNNLVDIFFGDRGKKTAQALAQKGGATDLAVLKAGAGKQLGIDEQVAMQMETAAAQAGIFQEAVTTLKATIGEPFLETKASVLKELNGILAQTAQYFKEHPNVTKFMAAMAVGASSFLVLAGSIMLVTGLLGSLKLVFSIAGPQIAAYFTPILSTLGIVTGVILVIAGLAYVIYKNWNTLKPQFESVMEGIREVLKAGKDAFMNFADAVTPVIGTVLQMAEKGAMLLLTTVLPVISTALLFLADILNGNIVEAFANAWGSMNPFARILLTLLAPSILAVTGYLAMMGAMALATAVKTAVLTAYSKISAAVIAIYRGVVAGAAAIQSIWNLAMTGGVGVTIAQKIALAALKPIMLAVSAATKIWAGVQAILNVVLTANPIGVVIMLIAALIAVVVLVVTHFKDLVEWVQKGWDKLKGFLGFKKEKKEELEEPIALGITETETIKKEVEISSAVDADTKKYLNGDFLKNMGIDGTTLSPEIYLQPEYQQYTQGVDIQELTAMTGIDGAEINPEVFVNPEYDVNNTLLSGVDLFGDLTNTIPDFSKLSEAMQDTKAITQQAGMDSSKAFADALGSAESLSGIENAIKSINTLIQNTLLKKEDMFLWGGNLIQSFIDGMNAKKTALMLISASLATVIGDYLKVESPSRKGELTTNHLWGGNLIQSFIDGMKGKEGLLRDTSAYLAGQTKGLQNPIGIENGRTQKEAFYLKNMPGNTATIEKDNRPIYIMIQGAEKQEKAIAKEVARELDKRGYGKQKRQRNYSLIKSPYGMMGGY